MSPVSKDRARVFLPTSGAAPIVHRDYGIAMSSEELTLEAKGVSVLSVRTSVNAKQCRRLFSTFIRRGLGKEAMHLCAIATFETDVFDGA